MKRILVSTLWLALAACEPQVVELPPAASDPPGPPTAGPPPAPPSGPPHGPPPPSGLDGVVERAIVDLGLHVAGPATVLEVALPLELNDASYGPKQRACLAGGYDLSVAAGMRAVFSGADVVEPCGSFPAMVWVVTRGAEVVCAYRSVRRDSSAAPGIWAVGDPGCSH